MLGMARLLLLAHAVSVLSESVPAPAEPPGCTHLIVTTVTVADASEVSWVIDLHQAGSQTISSDPFASHDTVQKEICVEAGTHSITLYDSFGDGWITSSGDQSTVQIDYRGGGSVLPQTTLSMGSEQVVTFDVSPQPAAPPSPLPPPGRPPNPPGVNSHETCRLHIRGVRGGGDETMMQLAEVTIYDPTGVPLPVLTSSSDCDFNSGETSTEALDGNPFSKWRCGNEDATLNIEFDSSQVVGSYTLTTADDHPERDPTSWTLSCVDVSGTSSQVSVVDDVVPPEERKTVYGLQRMSSHPPLPPPTPPSPPTPPLPPPPPPPPPGAPCWDVTVTTVTTSFASEQSWFIDSGSKYVHSPEFDNSDTHVQSACLEMGSHTITLLDSFSDGWSDGSKVTIVDALTGYVLLDASTLEDGGSRSATFEVVGFYPPAPPKTPPGVTHHTTCHLEFLSVVEGDMLQLGEITLYDTDGNALLHPDIVASRLGLGLA